MQLSRGKIHTDSNLLLSRYLPENDVILFSQKGFCALGLGLKLELAEIRLITSVKRLSGNVLDPN